MTDVSDNTVAKMLEGVSRGPWLYSNSGHLFRIIVSMAGQSVCLAGLHRFGLRGGLKCDGSPEANGRFIAWARDAVPALAADRNAWKARAEKAEADLAAMTAERDKWFEGAGAHHVASMREAQRADQNAARAEKAEAEVERLKAERDALAAQALRDRKSANTAMSDAIMWQFSVADGAHDGQPLLLKVWRQRKAIEAERDAALARVRELEAAITPFVEGCVCLRNVPADWSIKAVDMGSHLREVFLTAGDFHLARSALRARKGGA